MMRVLGVEDALHVLQEEGLWSESALESLSQSHTDAASSLSPSPQGGVPVMLLSSSCPSSSPAAAAATGGATDTEEGAGWLRHCRTEEDFRVGVQTALAECQAQGAGEPPRKRSHRPSHSQPQRSANASVDMGTSASEGVGVGVGVGLDSRLQSPVEGCGAVSWGDSRTGGPVPEAALGDGDLGMGVFTEEEERYPPQPVLWVAGRSPHLPPPPPPSVSATHTLEVVRPPQQESPQAPSPPPSQEGQGMGERDMWVRRRAQQQQQCTPSSGPQNQRAVVIVPESVDSCAGREGGVRSSQPVGPTGSSAGEEEEEEVQVQTLSQEECWQRRGVVHGSSLSPGRRLQKQPPSPLQESYRRVCRSHSSLPPARGFFCPARSLSLSL